ncbi:MAG: 1-phosphofructokinase family hexose kinase [Actinomycetota bacterium]
MITTLTLNPSVDRTVHLERLQVGEVQQLVRSEIEPGGKGINVARALAINGASSAAVFPADPVFADAARAELDELDVVCTVVPREERTRTNLSITEGDGTTTKLNEPGPPLTEEAVDALLAAMVAAEVDGRLAAAGSVPAGAGGDIYVRLAERLASPERSLAVDTSGPPLAALAGTPCAVVKPNLEELQSLFEQPLASIGAVVEAVTELRRGGWGSVLVSLGGDGALLVDDGGVHHGRADVAEVRNTVGAGDALLAGFLSMPDGGPGALTEALAWAHSAVRSPGTRAPAVTTSDRRAVALTPRIEPQSLLREAL